MKRGSYIPKPQHSIGGSGNGAQVNLQSSKGAVIGMLKYEEIRS